MKRMGQRVIKKYSTNAQGLTLIKKSPAHGFPYAVVDLKIGMIMEQFITITDARNGFKAWSQPGRFTSDFAGL